MLQQDFSLRTLFSNFSFLSFVLDLELKTWNQRSYYAARGIFPALTNYTSLGYM